MTRVWIINHFAIPPSESGGTRHYSLARELLNHGFAATIIAAASNYQTGRPRPLPEGVKAQLQVVNDVPFLWMKTATHGKDGVSRLLGMIYFAYQLVTNLPRRFVDAPEIIIGSTPHLFGAAASCFLAKHYKIPFVLEVRDIWPESLIELGGFSPYHPLMLIMKKLERYVYRNASRIVTLLPDAAPYFAQHGAKAENVVVIPNGVDTSILENASAEPVKKPEKFTVLYTGTIGIPNQMETFVEAAELVQNRNDVPPIQFVLVGEGIRKAALQQMAEEKSLTNMIFLPSVPKNEVAGLLARADAFYLQFKDCALYQWGVSPNKLFDYLLAAKPILYAANVKTNPVQSENAGISLKPADAKLLADAVVKLATMPEAERAAMGERGRAYVLAHHNFTALGKKLADCLKGLI